MGRRATNYGLPKWHKGKKVLCDISGEEHFENDGTMRSQRGLTVTKKFYDTLTDEQRATNVNGRLG